MKERILLEKLKEKAVFSVQDIERISNVSRAYAKLIAYRLVKRGVITRVTKNIYTQKKDIFVIASNIIVPSYISFWSASAYYGYTEQILNTIFLATTRRVKDINCDGYKIKCVQIKNFFGYRKIKTDEGELFIAEPEKLLIDAVEKQKQMGNFDEIINVFQKAEVAKEKIVEYLKRTKKLDVVKRVGYLLETIKNIDISKRFRFDRNYAKLNAFSKKYKSINAKWMVKV